MKCRDFRLDVSAEADGAVRGRRAERLREHLKECDACAAELAQIGRLRSLLRSHGRVAAPADLALALRVRLSQETHSNFLERLRVRLGNVMEPVAVPAITGLFTAIFLFGILIHIFAIPTPALNDDVPLQISTKPRLRETAPLDFNTGDQGLFLVVRINEEGRIVDYRVLNGWYDPAEAPKLRRILIFTQFVPATTFGVPGPATTVVNFSSISVKG